MQRPQRSEEEEHFRSLCDAIETVLARHFGGSACVERSPWFINHDYFGNRDVGVVIDIDTYSERVVHDLQELLGRHQPSWKIHVSVDSRTLRPDAAAPGFVVRAEGIEGNWHLHELREAVQRAQRS